MKRLRRAFGQTLAGFARILPVIVGVLALTNLAAAMLPPQGLADALPLEGLVGPLFGAVIGGLAAGHPLTSYVLAGEFTAAGIGLATVTAFIVSWVTVGVVQLPAEAAMLGARFALWRNLVSLVFAIVIGHVVAVMVTVVG
jgi:uncharacterized membrane protein YraQ (UPF0718 family)